MAIKLFETIKRVFGTEEATKSAAVQQNSAESHIEMVDEKKLQEEGNVDHVHVCNCPKRSQIYAKLENFCAEYRIDLEALKQMNFLEEISGCSVEEMTECEINDLISAIEKSLHRDWKAFWKERDAEDIQEIIHATKHIYNRGHVGGHLLGQTWNNVMTKKTLEEELISSGIIDKDTDLSSLSDEEIKQKVREYFNKELIGDTEDLSDKRIQRKYNRARKHFVYFINKFETDREKELLAAAVAEMDSDSKEKLASILLNSCGCDAECKGHVAKSLHEQVDPCKKDALGKTMTPESSASFYTKTFGNMFREDALKAKEQMQMNSSNFMQEQGNKIESLKQKRLSGQTLTDEEERILTYYENSVVGQNAGATLGIPQNRNFTQQEAREIVSDIMQKAEELGFSSDVINKVSDYIEKNPQQFSYMSKNDFVRMMDEVTEGKYSMTVSAKSDKTSQSDNKRNNEVKNDNEANADINKTKKTKEECDDASVVKPETRSELRAENKSSVNDTNPVTTPYCFINNTSVSKKTKVDTTVSQQNEELNTDLKSQKPKSAQKNDFVSYVRESGQTEGFKNYVKDHGEKDGLVEAFANIDIANENMVKKMYQQQDASEQFNIIKNLGTNLNEALSWSKDSTILKLDGEILSCSYATNEAKKAVEELKTNRT